VWISTPNYTQSSTIVRLCFMSGIAFYWLFDSQIDCIVLNYSAASLFNKLAYLLTILYVVNTGMRLTDRRTRNLTNCANVTWKKWPKTAEPIEYTVWVCRGPCIRWGPGPSAGSAGGVLIRGTHLSALTRGRYSQHARHYSQGAAAIRSLATSTVAACYNIYHKDVHVTPTPKKSR